MLPAGGAQASILSKNLSRSQPVLGGRIPSSEMRFDSQEEM